jgi:hypothetical protein
MGSNSRNPIEPTLNDISAGRTHFNVITRRFESPTAHEISVKDVQGGSTCPEQIGEVIVKHRHRSFMDRMLGKNKSGEISSSGERNRSRTYDSF